MTCVSSATALVAAQRIASIGEQIASHPVINEQVLIAMRSEFPSLKFTLCFEDDLGEREPYLSYASFDLHLMQLRPDSCAGLTFSPEDCAGVVVALHLD
ncbi:hypothetical protein L9G74_13680 [Shewanella sp. C32]|uniref:Uncharacterized protein n=1 Tax=Shewanella electrica TaxID=515560 RepID=A0ABT2FMD3_9GAMM|nr:hypothetical protein [Shewanella electrica]MCH1926134.1 hypothetical protein [Shewanella electrica]MCS4557497.1 hypothetical protein [Shewanella electrica]